MNEAKTHWIEFLNYALKAPKCFNPNTGIRCGITAIAYLIASKIVAQLLMFYVMRSPLANGQNRAAIQL